MTTSTQYAFNPEFQELADESFERCGIDPASLTARHIKSARMSLSLLFSEWSNKGPHLWAIDQQTLTLTQSTAAYETPVGTIAILDMVLRRSNVDTPIFPMARDEYSAIPNKTTEGIVSRYWFERINNDPTTGPTTLGTPKLHFWNVPENSTDDIVYYRMRSLQDVGAGSNTLDIPPRWQEAVVAGLAKKLAVKFAPGRIGPLTGEANSRFAEAHSEDKERSPSTMRTRFNLGLRR